MKIVVALFAIFALILQSCADTNFLDRSKKDQSVLQGTEVRPDHVFAKSVVLIAQDLSFQNGKPIFFGLCTGLIVSRRVVLTAAHCLDNGTGKMKVILNPNPRENLSARNDVYGVLDSTVHETYRFQKMFTDKELFVPQTLEDAATYSDLGIILVDRDFPEENLTNSTLAEITNSNAKIAVIAGFGKTTALKNPTQMNYTAINGVLKQADVELPESYIKQNQIVLSQWEKPGVCKGDSGAPLFLAENGEFKLLGIAVGVFSKEYDTEGFYKVHAEEFDECASYGVYVNVETQKIWIAQQIKDLESKAHALQKPIRPKN